MEDLVLEVEKEPGDLLAATSQKRSRMAPIELQCFFLHQRPASSRSSWHNGEMDPYSELDHATLVRNLKAVCIGLAIAIDKGGRRGGGEPPALCYQDVEEVIPLTLHKIAVAAGWIAEQKPRDWIDYDHGFADLLGGELVEKSYKEWFLGLVADTLTDLEVKAENNLAAQIEYENKLGEQLMVWLQAKGEELRAAEAKPSAKDKIR